jgi:NitT/TauT family transport system substrate-binding protein
MHLRLILNSGFSGPHAWFFLAQERGYFQDGGLDVEFLAGDGGAAVVPLIGTRGIDAGYGDINALAERAAFAAPQTTPVAVFSVFNAAPFTIAVRADGPLLRAADLTGSTLVGHAQDAALKLFPAFAHVAGVDARTVGVQPSTLGLGHQVRDLLLAGKVDGGFGYVNTIIAAMAPLGLSPSAVRFLRFADVLPDLYAHCLIVDRALLEREPQVVRALVHGLNQGLADTIVDIDAGMEALMRAAPTIDLAVQRRRLLGTLADEMAHPEAAVLGLGDIDDARLARGVALLARCGGWPRSPPPQELFTRAFLPSLAQRMVLPAG